MIPLLHENICTIFLHSWLQINGFSLDRLELKKFGKKYNLANPIIISNLEYSYIEYLQSGKSLDDFFDRQIIICRSYNKKLFKITTESIDRTPVFIYQTTKHNTYLFGPDISNLTSTNVIPCDLKIIMSLYGISKWPKDLNVFEPECGRTVSIYKVLNGKAVFDIESGHEIADIPIGLYKTQYYYIPNPKLIKARYFCRKYPDKCLLNTIRQNDRDKHEKICSDDSIISAKQV